MKPGVASAGYEARARVSETKNNVRSRILVEDY